jgi:hypothetical protein
VGARLLLSVFPASRPRRELSMATFHDYALEKSKQMRLRRFRRFQELAGLLPRPLRIIDIGGTNGFWEMCGWAGVDDVQITAFNLAPEERKHENIEVLAGDATNLSEVDDRSYDIAFSNSVIEHLFTWENQVAMAREMMRVATAYYCQTPNFWFPMEPHFQVPGWQWMPEGMRVGLLRRRRCGFRGPTPDLEAARRSVREVRLVGRRELRRLFPSCSLHAERFAGLVKSWTAYGGFPSSGR